VFDQTITVVAIAGLVVLSIGGVLYALLYPLLSRSARGDKRLERLKSKPSRIKGVEAQGHQKRRSVQDRLKELEQKQKKEEKKRKSPPLWMRLQQAGLDWSKPKFYVFSALSAVAWFVLGLFISAPALVAGGLAVVGGLGFPNWLIKHLRKRREKRFLDEFPNAVDVIVRGVKAGLPLGDCLGIISRESREPVRTEFKRVVEAQSMGMTLGQAVGRLYENMPLAEANFFAIVIAIQQQAGGNLSEALGNLAKVLRDRKKMKGKIGAMSMEAKASAAIIGSLPVIVTLLVYLSTPGYIMILFTHPIGNIILGVSAFWMFIGIMVMRKMINFDF